MTRLNGSDNSLQCKESPDFSISERLAQSLARISDIDLAREQRNDPAFGKGVEERLVWRELLDLELQALDEQFEKLCAAAPALAVS